MDNRYACASLFILLCENFEILCAGITQVIQLGWHMEKTNMTKQTEEDSEEV